jgi:hypothetical protein
MMDRRTFLARAAVAGAGLLLLPAAGFAWPGGRDARMDEEDRARLASWLRTLRAEGLAAADRPLGPAVARVGELARGAP